MQAMQQRISNLETEVAELKAMIEQLQPATSLTSAAAVPSSTTAFADPAKATAPAESSQTPTADRQGVLEAQDKKNLEFLRDTTIDLAVDTYYAYNFNHPVGRVNLLRAYDVLSNEFSLNQADSFSITHRIFLKDGAGARGSTYNSGRRQTRCRGILRTNRVPTSIVTFFRCTEHT